MAFLGSFAIVGLILLVGLIINIAIFGIGAVLRIGMWLVSGVLQLVIFLLGRLVVWSIRGVRAAADRLSALRR
ncbi:hypothetical protein [Clavibacter michiganensis]|uniref:hypothetical protein n=1 Tax=Clavibacter michiganensis TaxID=28447 RepID=UPI00292F8D51|nr:hypothetical protein [Clavibacter michiganensis]